MVVAFKRATKSAAKARIALIGPSGSGKSFSACAIASGLGKRVAVIDTERGSASLYADRFAFDVLELAEHHPEKYIEAIKAAERAGYDVIVIDSLSHAWMGRDGALELVDQAAKKSKSGNSFTAWRDVTPLHHQLVDAMLQSPCHVIATMRAKTEWVLDDGPNGKKTPRKVGLAAVQRDGMEYEFTIVGDLTLDHDMVISKTRWSELTDKVVSKPGIELGQRILAWLSDGAPASTPPVPAPTVPPGHNASAERDTLKAELAEHEKHFGGRAALLAVIGFWPKTLPAARAAVELARKARAAAETFDDDDAFPDEEAVQASAPVSPGQEAAPPPIRLVPKADEAQQPGPDANQDPEAAQSTAANGDAEPTTTPGGGEAYISVPAFWNRVHAAKVGEMQLAEDLHRMFGINNVGHLTPAQRAQYVATLATGKGA